jgi:plasmid stabilization system protein ParE
MSYELIVKPQAQEDIRNSILWYEEQRSGLGRSFLVDLEGCFSHIRKNPEIFAEQYKELRRGLLSRFPFGVYYQIADERVFILAVLHTSRSPREWIERIK